MADPVLPGVDDPDRALDARLREGSEAPDAPFVNRLAAEASPYLRQHAHNPVNWFPWGEEAFARAKAEGKPIFLSVGYSTCHWCHVMEHESFEDAEVAAFLNEHFIAVKVDREERPDVDAIYMTAVHLMRGQGGWPMTVVMDAEGQPFFAATYLPARDGDRPGQRGLLSIMGEVADLWQTDRERVGQYAADLSRKLAEVQGGQPPQQVDLKAPDKALKALKNAYDPIYGGFSGAPKFPQPSLVSFVLRKAVVDGDAEALKMVTHTLDQMALGGMYDHLGGGFHRYSVDGQWHEPHYEKMLYDNAQLALLYTEAWQVTGSELYARVVQGTLGWLLGEMADPQGGFFAATDADSLDESGHKVEGAYFMWTRPQLKAALGEGDGLRFAEAYGIEGEAEPLHRDPKVPLADDEALRAKLKAHRDGRSAPHVDRKVVTAWNGLTISALAVAGDAFDRDEWTAAATSTAETVLKHNRLPDGRLARSRLGDRIGSLAVLDDHAFLLQGLVDLFERTGDVRWLKEALVIKDDMQARFADPAGGWFLTDAGGEALLAQPKPDQDGAEPSGNAVAAVALIKLGNLLTDSAIVDVGVLALDGMGATLNKYPSAAPHGMTAVMLAQTDLQQVVLAKGEGDALGRLLSRSYLPNAVRTPVKPGLQAEIGAVVPSVADKPARDGRSTAYVCTWGACKKPTTDPGELAEQLGIEAD